MTRRSYLLHGTAPWDDPWLTEQNLAHALAARGNRVLFVEPPISAATPLRAGGRRHTGRLLRRGLRRRDGVTLTQPISLPPLSNPRSQALSAPLLRRQLRRAARRAGLTDAVVVSARNTSALTDAVSESLHIYLVKDWIQAGSSLLGRDVDDLNGEVASMVAWADLVCATSPQLQDGLAHTGVKSALLRHGFHAGLAQLYHQPAEPPDLRRLPRPLIGYAGRIDARLDVELLTRLARAIAGGTVVLLGPISPRLPAEQVDELRGEPNIAMLGTRTRQELPAYLRTFDCSVMPYADSEWLRYGSPLKLWDLLYAGPPIVGAGCSSLAEYAPHLVAFARDHDDFISAVLRALRNGRAGEEERRRHALENSWEARASQLEDMVASLVQTSS